MPNEVVFKAAELLRAQFANKDRQFVHARLSAWCARVLDHYWPAKLSDSDVATATLRIRHEVDALLAD